MDTIVTLGIVLFGGFVLGELAMLAKLPRITGYIVAGVLLNPGLTHLLSPDFPQHTAPVLDVALAFITFSVGGTLSWGKIRRMGRVILTMSLLEALGAFLLVAGGFVLVLHLAGATHQLPLLTGIVPLALVLGTLAAPTDPSATLAVKHEFKAEGPVSGTILGIAAFDDGIGLMIYSVFSAVAVVLVSGAGLQVASIGREMAVGIGGAVGMGVLAGLLFNLVTRLVKRETDGMLIVLTLAVMTLCFGLSRWLGADEMLATMTMGAVVVNFNPLQEKVFGMLERYTEELVFVLFFVISGLRMEFAGLASSLVLIVLFMLLRISGKFVGVWLGGKLSGAEPIVRRYTVGGLVPQGGIVIGLALAVNRQLDIPGVNHLILNIILGATVLHEILGPLAARFVLVKAGEIQTKKDT